MSRLIYCKQHNNTEIYRIDSIKRTLKELQDEVNDLKNIVNNFQKLEKRWEKKEIQTHMLILAQIERRQNEIKCYNKAINNLIH